MSSEQGEPLVATFVDTDAVEIKTEAGVLRLVRTNMDGNWHGVGLEVAGELQRVPLCYTPSAEVLAAIEVAEQALRAHVTAPPAFDDGGALVRYVAARLPQAWRLYSCTDCDPALATEGDEDEPYEQAYHVLLPLDETTANPDGGPLDACPRCGSLYSLVADRTAYTITLGLVAS